MNICVTGCLGHIGSAYIRNIPVGSAERIYLIDNFLTQRYASLFDLPSNQPFEFIEMDARAKEMQKIIADSDACIHLAAVTNAEASFHRQDEVEKVNKEGLKYIAELCAAHDCRLLFPSSTSVYGVQEGFVDENCSDADLKPQSPYAESKMYGENLLAKLGKEKGLKYLVFRLGTIFGYSIGMRFHTAVNKFIWQAAMGDKLTVWRTALHQKRPYCALNDCIEAINFTLNKDIFENDVYNILTENYTVNDIIETIKKYVPDVKIELVDSPIMNQLSYNVDTKKSRQRGFQYKGNLENDIKETLYKLKNARSSSTHLSSL